MIFIAVMFPVKNPRLSFVLLGKQYAWMANCYCKYRRTEPISKDTTFYVTGGKWSEMHISV